MSVTVPKGFSAGGMHCGIKDDGVLDLAMVAADGPVVTTAVFTSNVAAAAPVTLSREHVANSYVQAVVINSGCANAATGALGDGHAGRMAAATAAALSCATSDVLVCSTGPIGPLLPIDAVEAGIGQLAGALGRDLVSAKDAARGIMTTDTFPKTATFVHTDGWAIGGIAKGAAMIRPDMATMLAVVTTDLVLTPEQAGDALKAAVAATFNSLNMDGCMSTNDTVILMASGESGMTIETEPFGIQLTDVCESLARQMARDGEETTRVVDVVVEGAVDVETARTLGLEVSDSDLVRSSFFGGDPNWGRILQALGQAGVPFDPRSVDIHYEETIVARGGVAMAHDRTALLAQLTGDFMVTITVGDGPGRARIITTDLTPGYVEFNGGTS